MLIDSDLILIEKFINDELSLEEARTFKERLKVEPQLHEGLNMQLNMIAVLKSNEEEVLRNSIKQSIPPIPKQKERSFSKIQYGIAASIILLIVFSGVYYIINQGGFANQDIAISYFEPYPLNSISRGEKDDLSNLAVLYNDKKYEKVLPKLIALGDQKDIQNKYNLVIGSTYFELKNWEKAAEWFLPGTKSGDQVFKNHANWYYALSLLMKKDEQGEILLNQISKSKGPYQDLAKKLLRELD